MTRADFAALLARAFVGELPVAEVDRLYAATQRAIADPAWRAGQVELFRDARAVHGLAWWEERGAGGGATPWRDTDFAAMLLLTDPRLDPRPPPRLHCPAAYVGRWRDDLGGEHVLAADGAVTGDPARAGWTWRVHAGRHDGLRLGPPAEPRRVSWLVVGRTADALHLESPTDGALRVWRRG